MLRLLRTILSIFLLHIAIAWPLKALSAECDTAKVQDDVRRWLSKILDYEVRAQIVFEGQKIGAHITGKLPDRLRMQLQMMIPSGRMVQTVVFDGVHQWIESKHSSSTHVLKISLAGLTTKERPFDTSYYLMGTGLLNGEGFPETITNLLSMYDLSAFCSDESIALSGPIDVQALTDYAARRRSEMQQASIEKFAKKFGYLRIDLERDSYVISRYSMGPFEATLLFTVNFQEIRTNQDVPAEVFVYTPPAGVKPEDITNTVKNEDDA